MLFEELVETSQQLAAHRSRLKKSQLLSDCLSRLENDELPIAVKYLCGELPQGKIGLGGALVRDVLKSIPVEDSINGITTPKMTILTLNRAFDELAEIKGTGSKKRRMTKLTNLFAGTDSPGRSFLVKLILGEMRHGAVEGVISDAIAKMSEITPQIVRRATMLSGDIAEVALTARMEGEVGVAKFSLDLFRPIQPMLAEPVEEIGDAMQQLGRAVLEYKLDGVRLQVHKDGDQVRVFSRHLKEVTWSVPEVVDLVRASESRKLILDGEVLAMRPDGRPHPFQTTMRRFGRNKEVETLRATLPLTVKFFDCLMYDDQDLIDCTTPERHQALSTAIGESHIIRRITTDNEDVASDFMQAAMRDGHEGVMAKSLEADYQAGGRGKSWLKIKPSHTLDLAIIAAEWGSGRRKGWLSNLHLAARIGDTGEFAMIGKTFKGLTDELLRWQTHQLLQLETHREDYVVRVQPQLVAEIAFNEVQQSPRYDSGFALRFARVKQYRSDKAAGDADTIEMVEQLFKNHRR